MTHRAEQILAAVQTKVTGLVTTGARVERGRNDPLAIESTPALRVVMGADQIVEPWAQSLLDSELEVDVIAYVHDASSNVDTVLNQIRQEVIVALMTDQTLALAFVRSIVEIGTSKPDLSADMTKPGGHMEMQFKVQYRRSVADPSA